MNDLFLGFLLISLVLTIAYLVKGILKRSKSDVIKAGLATLSIFVFFVLFVITIPETEESSSEPSEDSAQKVQTQKKIVANKEVEQNSETKNTQQKQAEEASEIEKPLNERNEKKVEPDKPVTETGTDPGEENSIDIVDGYQIITVAGGDQSGQREANVAVNIGFGERDYWAFTNEYGQLIRVIADEIILQDEANEEVTSQGRYYYDEAKVPGTESSTLDEGHVIADSLGGVGNAYNITPQNSTMNRHGDQAYMERSIRAVGGARAFEAIITYPNTETQVPSHYHYTYTIQGEIVSDSFENVDPDEYNASQGLTSSEPKEEIHSESEGNPTSGTEETSAQDVTTVDANGNGTVTIAEAKDAGFSMPISQEHWLYPYMIDRDGDGLVGE